MVLYFVFCVYMELVAEDGFVVWYYLLRWSELECVVLFLFVGSSEVGGCVVAVL